MKQAYIKQTTRIKQLLSLNFNKFLSNFISILITTKLIGFQYKKMHKINI